MNYPRPSPRPRPCPNGIADGPDALEIHHRDTDTQSHRRAASAKTRRREGITKSSHQKPSHIQLGGQRTGRSAVKGGAPHQMKSSVFLRAPLCLCGEKTATAPEIGAPQ